MISEYLTLSATSWTNASQQAFLYGSGAQVRGSGYSRSGITYPAISSHLWTPAQDKDVDADTVIDRYRKKPANRQGPPKPKRAPKRL